MTTDNRNIILAIVLSIAIIVAWQVFFAQPMLEQQRQQQELAEQRAPTLEQPSAPGEIQPPGVQAAPGQAASREAAIAATPRLSIDTPSVTGSINLRGGLIDDLQLKRYRVTVEPNSPIVTLLSPANAPGGFFVDHGWTPAPGSDLAVPQPHTVWSAPPGAVLTPDRPVTLTWTNEEGLTFRRTISVDRNYLFSVRQDVINASRETAVLYAYSRIKRHGIPQMENIFIVHEGLIGVFDEVLEEVDYSEVQEAAGPMSFDTTGGWLGITDKYWAATVIPDQETAVSATFRHNVEGGQEVFQTDYITKEPVTIRAGSTATVESLVFAGAKVVDTVNSYAEQHGIVLFDRLIDWGWFPFLTQPLFWLLNHIQTWVGNFGLAILVTTVLVKIFFFPLANKSYVAMSQMKKLQPEMVKIKERFGDDRMKQQEAMMALYKKQKVSPLSGCLPVVVQIPVFFALYKVLYVTIEMRHAPFYGWIRDLSAPDPTSLFTLFGLIPWSPPAMLMIGILPIMMGITMWVQMKLNPTPPDPIQAKLFNLMPLVFTFILAPFPAGLVLYWTWNNLLSITQQYVIMRRQGVDINLLQNIRESLPNFARKKAE
ncbi:MAG TPA: membrane protein insertase YidC [Aestuariivirgaceae bacterium]|nr:membrane protein insertase YidC [Aestuariivirgaceae bacterium]